MVTLDAGGGSDDVDRDDAVISSDGYVAPTGVPVAAAVCCHVRAGA